MAVTLMSTKFMIWRLFTCSSVFLT